MVNIAKKSFNEILDLLREKAKEHYSDKEWSGLQEYSLDELLIKIVAESSVLNGYYIDARTNQSYLDTATLFRDIRRIIENVGLTIQEKTGGTTTVQFTSDGSTDVTIPKGTKVTTENGIIFSTVVECVLNASNSYTNSCECVHSNYSQMNFRASGEIEERLELNDKDVIIEKLAVYVDGVQWSMVDDLFNVNENSKVFRVRFNDNGTIYLLFGNGTYGERLPADAQILVDVFSGGGLSGNGVSIGSINILMDTFSNSSTINTVANTTISSGGRARATLEDIKASIPGQQRSVSAIANKENAKTALQKDLSWLAGASISRTFENVGGVCIPVITVTAYPFSSDVVSMSVAQQSALATTLSNKGELGSMFVTKNATKAPIEIRATVKLTNKNLSLQKDAEIKKILISNSGSSLFAFDKLGFNSEYLKQDVANEVESISDVVYCDITRFSRVPYALSISGSSASTGSFVDCELGSKDQTEEGFFEFVTTSTTVGNVTFNRPFKPDQLSTNFVRDSNKNWTLFEKSFGTGSGDTVFNDSTGPYIKLDGNQVRILQNDSVWSANQFSSSNYTGKTMLMVAYSEGGVNKQYFYHVSGSTYNSIVTLETKNAPLNGGPGISASLSSSGISNISFSLYQDQTSGSVGKLVTPTNTTIQILYNSDNTLYLSSSTAFNSIPINEYSFIQFPESAVSISAGNWASINNHLKVRLGSNFNGANDKIRVYTSNIDSSRLYFTNDSEVFTLAESDIDLTFI